MAVDERLGHLNADDATIDALLIVILATFCENHGPIPILLSKRRGIKESTRGQTSFTSKIPSKSDPKSRCKACSPAPGMEFMYSDGILTHNHDVMSSSDPCHLSVLRALSCEVTSSSISTSGREDSFNSRAFVIFSPLKGVSCLSVPFDLMDCEARGFKRSFSMLVVSKERNLLLSFLPSLLKMCDSAILSLQCKANVVFERRRQRDEKSFAIQTKALHEILDDLQVWPWIHSLMTSIIKKTEDFHDRRRRRPIALTVQ